MRDVVRFALNGRLVEIANPDPTRTLLAWLREDRGLVGTKEGCAEGDCGACTVMQLTRADEAVRAAPVNACILFLPMVDGRVFVTVEGLNGAHPVQAALVARHGSQCGFCTPGIVMALAAHHANAGGTDLEALNDALAGNLCRCTGYGPILDAARDAAGEAFDVNALWREVRGVDAPLALTHGARRWFAPRTLDDACALGEAHPDATFVAGATDVGLWVTKQCRVLETVIALQDVAELRQWRDMGDALEIGAGVTHADAFDALAALHPSIRELMRRFGGAQVRASGTIGGNIANGSPVGDLPPVLMALGAEISLRHGVRTRRMPLEDFFVAYGRQDRATGEIVTHIHVPKIPAGAHFGVHKLSKRFDQDISSVCAAFCVAVDGGTVHAARIAFGGMAPTPKRARAAEAALVGQPWTTETVAAAARALDTDFTPISDMRGAAAYRRRAAHNLLLRFHAEAMGDATPLCGLASLDV